MGASVLVAGLSSAFGVVLLTATAYIAALLLADPYIGDSGTLAVVVGILGVLLLGVAVYVGAMVTANTFATVVAGRTRRIALLRLIGASAGAQRREVATQGLVVGVIGSVAGLVGGTALAGALAAGAAVWVDAPADGFVLVRGELLVPAAVVALTTWAAAWAGSRRVLAVTPLQALDGAQEVAYATLVRRRGRHVAAGVLTGIGGGMLALGIVVGLVTPLGVVIAFVGGLLSFTGLSLGAAWVMPPLLRLVGRGLGGGVVGRLAAQNALRHPERSARMAIGVVMSVALVTMFAVATESAKSVLVRSSGGELPADLVVMIDAFAAIMMGLVGVAAVIAAVGLVNLLAIGVRQRRAELGLLRALGLSAAQTRRLVLLEAVHLTVTGLLFGLVLGAFYGWAGAQSLLGAVPMPPQWQTGTLVAPAVPLAPVVVVVAATALLTLVAAVLPTRTATRVSPLAALSAP
ncbi:FtsX-like permease family protein [Microbacterium sp. LRZ72]|nr:FtsX-like permease family protein [Microbacterium sp. LRZ72]MDX2376665.1 FtsX-like permease family protein [Microbacterium sp. LRZ72]